VATHTAAHLVNDTLMPTIPSKYTLTATIAFLRAWAAGDVPDVLAALEEGANPDANLDGTPLLYTAAGMGDETLVESLLRAGANANARRSSDGATALHSIANSGTSDRHIRTFERLLASGADISAQTASSHGHAGSTPMELAVDTNNLPIVDALRAHNARGQHSTSVTLQRARQTQLRKHE
jgi:ankyrin repeat protein